MLNKDQKLISGLYIVSTPIGNLEDITLRAIRILKESDKIYCEDTRITKRLLKQYDIITKLTIYNDINGERIRPKIIKELSEGMKIALVSDAGTPLISDPGYKLVKLCRDKNLEIYTVPGPSALISSLSISGLPTDKFYFTGFLPKKNSARVKEFNKFNTVNCTVIIYETAKRIKKTLLEIKNIYPSFNVVIARELTKIHEEVISGDINFMLNYLSNHNLRGELVILINSLVNDEITSEIIDIEINKYIGKIAIKEITNILANKTNIPKNIIYKRCLEIKKKTISN
ncbi:MAG: 16S rRNA (cytidine(1402)-2'-O)-methyltransferase [Rhodobiaceae bacterium]|jgi:16S rRNA (cytidine1402-2'-O)-methyltransferase|nr:16S rRNA (cytidine(1402)-2'-O)-methyltransferase [Rhodobiaceae bacterium]MBT6223644.1 16S rRNA (cytidine(1402)-2'-O)-methyltransferase [Rhodobiaceae bacterium]